MSQRLFKEDPFEEESQWENPELLSTIRVPRNLLYLTDKLPKPTYDSSSRKSLTKAQRSSNEKLSRRTQDPSGSLPVPEVSLQNLKSKSQTRPEKGNRGNKNYKPPNARSSIDEVSESRSSVQQDRSSTIGSRQTRKQTR
jgi:hypothetical protein